VSVLQSPALTAASTHSELSCSCSC